MCHDHFTWANSDKYVSDFNDDKNILMAHLRGLMAINMLVIIKMTKRKVMVHYLRKWR